MKCYRRLPVDGMCNIRELGGFSTADGTPTNYRRFVRCEVPRFITRKGLSFLQEYGVRASIDLRGARELGRLPSPLSSEPWVKYLHAPVYNEQVAAGSAVKRPNRFVKWPEMYIEMADQHMDWVKRVFELLANACGEGAVMFNCTTGKDRTGIISALLLGLAGVHHADIIADYCVSEVYMRPVYMELLKTMPPSVNPDGSTSPLTVDDPFFKTAPENMAALLEHLDSEYGGIYPYLTRCGLSEDTLSTLKNALVG